MKKPRPAVDRHAGKEANQHSLDSKIPATILQHIGGTNRTTYFRSSSSVSMSSRAFWMASIAVQMVG